MQEFKEGDLVKWVIQEHLPKGTQEEQSALYGKPMRVVKINKTEVLVEFDGDTYGFNPEELEHTSKLHEQLK